MNKEELNKKYSDANYYFQEFEERINDHNRKIWKIQLYIEKILLYFNIKTNFYKSLENDLYKKFNMTFEQARKYLNYSL
jgi:hypothetical protein